MVPFAHRRMTLYDMALSDWLQSTTHHSLEKIFNLSLVIVLKRTHAKSL
jgi:hypothetical protein